MTKPTLAAFRAYELNWEPAAQAILKTAGQPICSAFTLFNPDGTINRQTFTDDGCFVTYEPGDVLDTILAFRASPLFDGGQAVEPAAFGGTLVVTRRVPMGDLPTKPGESPSCYEKLCKELGIIRAALLNSERPFDAVLPWYDILTITELQPNRQIDGPRSANQVTLRFGVKWLPAEGVWD